MESYVVEQVPYWRDFEVTDSGEYPGFRVGHAGGTLASWAKPLIKYEKRAAELSGSGVSASVGTATYNVKVATITSYVEQLCPPNARYMKMERSAIEKTLHCPHNALPILAASRLGQAGMRSFTNLSIRADAAQCRTTLKTCSCWRVELAALNAARLEYGPACNYAKKKDEALVDFSWWDSEAFADVLSRASVVDITSELELTNHMSLQSAVYRQLLSERIPCELTAILKPRVVKHLSNFGVEAHNVHVDMDRALASARTISAQAGWALVRTWCNGWPTACRTGGARRPCIFGCPMDLHTLDTLQHYLICERLWRPIIDEVVKLTSRPWNPSVWTSLALSTHGASTLQDNERCNLISALTVAVDVFNVTNRSSNGNLLKRVQESMRRFAVSGTIAFRDFTELPKTRTRTESIDMSPASDPNLESTAPLTPRVPSVWDAYNPDDSEGERTPRITAFDNILFEQEMRLLGALLTLHGASSVLQ